jgi:hypothetical protein
LFLNEYLKRENITDYVFAVVNNACRRVAEMFGIKNIEVLPHRVGDDIISLERATGKNLNIVILNDGWLGDPLQWLRGYKGLNFERMFRYFVFDHNDDVPHELPPKEYHGREIDALFEKYGLIKGRTVVLSPYSNTLFELPDDFWESIAGHFGETGYTVCTNCAVPSERPVRGTKAIFFPLGLAIDFLDAAGLFIGVRSGLCDIISSSTCRKVILYDKDGFFYKCSPYEYFSLERMGLCGDAIEIEYRDNLKYAHLNQMFTEIE